jgi:hypothetical protein
MEESASSKVATPAVRRFNLGDAMIMVAALAVGLVLAQVPIGQLSYYAQEWSRALRSFPSWSELAFSFINRTEAVKTLLVRTFMFVEPLACLFSALTLVVLVVRLRRPRPELRELLRQPGFIACLAVVVFSLVAADLWFLWSIDLPVWLLAGAATVLAWVVLALPPWRAERSWIDRLGRVVGAFWILMTYSITLFQFW